MLRARAVVVRRRVRSPCCVRRRHPMLGARSSTTAYIPMLRVQCRRPHGGRQSWCAPPTATSAFRTFALRQSPERRRCAFQHCLPPCATILLRQCRAYRRRAASMPPHRRPSLQPARSTAAHVASALPVPASACASLRVPPCCVIECRARQRATACRAPPTPTSARAFHCRQPPEALAECHFEPRLRICVPLAAHQCPSLAANTLRVTRPTASCADSPGKRLAQCC